MIEMINNDDTKIVITPPVIIHSKPLADYLSSNAIRLPPTYIGARRVRPSDRARDAYRHHLRERDCGISNVDGNDYHNTKRQNMTTDDAGGDDNDDGPTKRTAIDGNTTTIENNNDNCNKNDNDNNNTSTLVTPTTNGIIYKIKDSNGTERRMTKKEKKQHKFLYKKMQAEEKKKRKRETNDDNGRLLPSPVTANLGATTTADDNDGDNVAASANETPEKKHTLYFKLEVNQQNLDDELTELKGEKRVLPAMLSGAQAHIALADGILLRNDDPHHHPSPPSSSSPTIDDDLAARWSLQLKRSMIDAETARIAEVTIRPMAYHLTPEVWTRLRPSSSPQQQQHSPTDNVIVAGAEGLQWSFVVPQRRRASATVVHARRYRHHEAICRVLRNDLRLHVSCGATFGCDLLLYDGHRDERHAFAGLRIVTPDDVGITTTTTTPPDTLPLPSTYDLAGYVRGLNTAGKLALLATTVEDDNNNNDKSDDDKSNHRRRVLFVDLALEKILSAPTHQRTYKRDKFVVRKEVGLHLDKTKTG